MSEQPIMSLGYAIDMILQLQRALASIHRRLAVEGQLDQYDRAKLHEMVMGFPPEAREIPPPPPEDA